MWPSKKIAHKGVLRKKAVQLTDLILPSFSGSSGSTNVVSVCSAKICCFWSVVHNNISIATWYVQMQDLAIPKTKAFPAPRRALLARLPLATGACYNDGEKHSN